MLSNVNNQECKGREFKQKDKKIGNQVTKKYYAKKVTAR